MSSASAEVPNVLIVEDEMILRMRAVDIVEDAGFHPVEAVNADEAISILESRSDISLLCHWMPIHECSRIVTTREGGTPSLILLGGLLVGQGRRWVGVLAIANGVLGYLDLAFASALAAFVAFVAEWRKQERRRAKEA